MWPFILADTILRLLAEQKSISAEDIRNDILHRRAATLDGPLLSEAVNNAVAMLDALDGSEPHASVTLAANDYAELLRRVDQRDSEAAGRPYRMSRSPIDRDPELARFVLDCSKSMIVDEIIKACAAEFGTTRTPSRSAIYRFQQRRFSSAQRDVEDSSKID